MSTLSTYVGDGSTKQFDIAFTYRDASTVKVAVDGVDTAFTFINPSRVELPIAPFSGAEVSLYRQTGVSTPVVDFTDGAIVRADDLDSAVAQARDRAEEIGDLLEAFEGRSVKAPPGETGPTLPSAAARANKYPVFDADGNVSLSSGTGADEGLRDDLATTGSIMVGYGGRTVKARLDDTISVMDHDASGVGTIVDTSALQAALDAAATYGGDLGKAAYIPSGLYPLDATLTPYSYSALHGEGPHQSVLRNDVVPIPTIPAFTATGALTFAAFRHVGARGQKSFLDVTGTTDHLTFTDIFATGMADAGFRFRNFLQTSRFERVVVEGGEYGIVCENAVVNRNTFDQPEFKNLNNSALKWAGSEDNLVIGGRFEGTGSAGKYILDIDSVHSLTFLGGYFEGSHEYLLRSTNGAGTISFESVHFTYYTAGVPYKWDVDAGTQLVFKNCHSAIPMTVPAGSILIGYNHNIKVAQGGGSFSRSGPRGGQVDLKGVKGTGTTLDADFLTFTRPAATNAPTNQQAVSGKLRLTLSGYTGGFPQSLTKTYDILIEGKTNFNVTLAQAGGATVDNSSAAFNFVITGVSQTATAITLHVQATGLQAGVENIMSASFEWTGHSYTEGGEFVVTAP